MQHYTGIQIDLRLTRTLPQQVAHWLSLHTQGTGNLIPMNRVFQEGSAEFVNWKGATFRLVEDDPEYGTHWHLKSAGSCVDYSAEHLSFFLHELQPWVINKPMDVVARVVDNVPTTTEVVFHYDPATTLVRCRKGSWYVYDNPDQDPRFDTSHPKDYSVEQLSAPLGQLDNYPNHMGSWHHVYHYPTNSTVSPKQEEKRILARQFNERRAATELEEINKQLAALEGK